MNLKNKMYRVKDNGYDDYYNYLESTPEGQKRSAANARLENWAEHFQPTLLSEEWDDDEHCTVVLGDKNSSVKMTINCIGTYNEGLLDFGIVDTYDHKRSGMPDDDWFLVNAIRNELQDNDELFYTFFDFLGENLMFGSNEDEISDSRKIKDDSTDLLNLDVVIVEQFDAGKADYRTDEFKDGQVCSLDEFLRKCAGLQHNIEDCDHSDVVVEENGKYRMDFLDKKNNPVCSIWFEFVILENAKNFILSYMNKSFY